MKREKEELFSWNLFVSFLDVWMKYKRTAEGEENG